MLRSIFAGLFAIVLTLGLGISSVSAKTVEVKLGTDAGMLAFEPSTVNISAGDKVKFVNNKLAPHNAVFDGHEELSHADLAFAPGESWEETFDSAFDNFNLNNCDFCSIKLLLTPARNSS